MNFFAELKRRNVYKVAIAYAVVSWLHIQGVVDFLSGLRSAAMDDQGIYCCHYPLLSDRALVLSWAFEITAEGIKLESEIAPNKSIAWRSGRNVYKSRGSAFASDNQGWPDKMGCSKMIALLSILAYASNPHPTAEYCHRSQATR